MQHTAIQCKTLQQTVSFVLSQSRKQMYIFIYTHNYIYATHYMQLTATHCNALQHTATHCNALQQTLFFALH